MIPPYQISKGLNDNAYQVALPSESRMSSTFNKANLIRYEGPPSPPASLPVWELFILNLQTFRRLLLILLQFKLLETLFIDF